MYKRRLDMMGQHPHPQHQHHQQQQQDQRVRTLMDCVGGAGGPKGAPSHSSSSSSNYLPTVDDLSCSSVSDTGSEQDWTSPTSSSSSAAKRARMSYDGYGASGPSSSSVSNTQHQQQLLDHSDPTGSPHRGGLVDDDRRKVRRERNKLAAARCRQRRVNLTNTLMEETEALEGEKTRLEREIESLYRQTNELQFVLDSHCKRCQMNVDNTTGRSDPLPSPVDLTSIKTERPDGSSSQRLMIPGVYNDAKFGMNSRPNSLPISSSMVVARGGGGGMDTPQFSICGSSVLTPCSMTLGFMADGHTGLTPITGMPSAAEGPSSIDCMPSTQTLMNL